MPFTPYKRFAEQAEADSGCAALGLDADGLPGRNSPYWDGVPPMSFDGSGGGGDAGGGGTIVYRRIVNGPNRFRWLITRYDEASDTALGCANLNYDDGGRWGLIPMRHVRMLGGRVDAAWQRPRPYADAVGCPARVSAPEARLIRTPPHSLVGFDVLPPANGGRIPGATIEIPRGRRACGTDSDGTRLYEYCYDGVPQDGAGSGVVLDTIYQSCDARALSLAGRLNGSYAYAIRVCADDGGCALCRDRPLKRSLRRRRHSPRRHRRPAGEAAAAAEAARTRQ